MLINQIKRDLSTVRPVKVQQQTRHPFEDFLQSDLGSLKILVLEPDQVYREMLCRFAIRRGATATGCGTFQQLKNNWIENTPDVVIVSYAIDGTLKAPEILRLLGSIPVIILKNPKTDIQHNFVWPRQLKKIANRSEGAGSIIDDALAFASEYKAEQMAFQNSNVKKA